MKQYTWIFIAIALFLIPAAVHAQTSVSLGPKAGIDLGDAEEPFIGADVRIEVSETPVRINPFFNFYFAPENITFWSAGVNGLFDIELDDESITPYAGAGLQIFRTSVETPGIDIGIPGFEVEPESSSTTDFGLTGVGGIEFRLDGGFRPFVQAELGIVFNEIENLTLFGIGGGVLFDL